MERKIGSRRFLLKAETLDRYSCRPKSEGLYDYSNCDVSKGVQSLMVAVIAVVVYSPPSDFSAARVVWLQFSEPLSILTVMLVMILVHFEASRVIAH